MGLVVVLPVAAYSHPLPLLTDGRNDCPPFRQSALSPFPCDRAIIFISTIIVLQAFRAVAVGHGVYGGWFVLMMMMRIHCLLLQPPHFAQNILLAHPPTHTHTQPVHKFSVFATIRYSAIVNKFDKTQRPPAPPPSTATK